MEGKDEHIIYIYTLKRDYFVDQKCHRLLLKVLKPRNYFRGWLEHEHVYPSERERFRLPVRQRRA